MDPFQVGVAWLLKAEGVESNDPHDPGGLTRFGISQRAHPDVSVAALTEAEAIEIYRLRYWSAYRLDRLPPVIAIAVLDAAVNQGPRPAIRMLQHAVRVEMDGIIGAQTIAACYRADPDELLAGYCARRAVYYANLSTFGRFGVGWMRRLFALHALCDGLARRGVVAA